MRTTKKKMKQHSTWWTMLWSRSRPISVPIFVVTWEIIGEYAVDLVGLNCEYHSFVSVVVVANPVGECRQVEWLRSRKTPTRAEISGVEPLANGVLVGRHRKFAMLPLPSFGLGYDRWDEFPAAVHMRNTRMLWQDVRSYYIIIYSPLFWKYIE